MTSFIQDVRHAVRALLKAPGFALVAVLTLTLGIGANTTLFSLIDAVLLRSLPFRDPDRLVEIWGKDAARGGLRVPVPIFEALRDRSATFDDITIYGSAGGTLRTPDGAVRIFGRRVSANYLNVLGVRPLAGRGLLPEDERVGAPAVMVVSYGFWQRRLGGDPQAVGRTVFLDSVPYTVVAIMPPEFQTTFGIRGDDFWSPYVSEKFRQFERENGYELIGQVSSVATIDQARQEIQSIAASIDVNGWGSRGRTLDAVPLLQVVVGDSAYVLQLLLGAVAVVLAIACSNLALLSLARSDRRLVEFATRKAIGAPVSQLFRMALMESLLVSAAGAIGGIALSYWLLPVMLALAPMEIPRITNATVDGRVLTVAVGLAALTGCAFGLAPALRLSRLSVIEAMKRRLSPQKARFRSALVVGQVAASVALLVLTGLIGRTFLTLLPSNPGFEAGSRTALQLSLPPFPQPTDRIRVLDELQRRVRQLPGIVEVGLGSNFPFGHDDGFRPVRAANGTEFSADVRAISANYFQLLQMPLTQGRVFTADDDASSPRVAVVNQTFARKLASLGDVLGRSVEVGSAKAVHEIVGIVADARSSGTTTEVWDEIYVPYAQSNTTVAYLIVRSQLDSGTLDVMLRKELRAVAPEAPDHPLLRATAIEDMVSRALAGPRFSAILFSAFSANALLLAAIGVFGLVSYSVSQRRFEYGIRAALGAHSSNLIRMTMRSAAMLIATGVLVGIIAAVYLTRFVETQLYAIEPLDMPTFTSAAAVMTAAALIACYVPARRAARVDPLVALRYE